MCKTVNPPSGPSELLLLNASFLPQLRCITPERRQQRKHKTKESSKKSEEGTPVPSPNPGFLSHSTLTCTKTHTCLHSKRAPATITKWAPVKPLTRREKQSHPNSSLEPLRLEGQEDSSKRCCNCYMGVKENNKAPLKGAVFSSSLPQLCLMMNPGPCCSQELQCHCLCQRSFGPTRLPRKGQTGHPSSPQLHSHWSLNWR